MRKALSKRTRFNIFKRDGFTCQYCGAHPPGVILHVDHITPVAEGGTSDIDNLVTACEPCNLGKGAVSLSVVPQSLAEKAAKTKEREEQIIGYEAVLAAKRDRLESQAWTVIEVLMPGRDSVPRDQFISIKRFVDELGVSAVLTAAERAVSGVARDPFRYFCGTCWDELRNKADRPN